MAYIYMDESGDLGFDFCKNRTSKFFVITFLYSKSKEIPKNVIKKFFQRLKGRKIKIKAGFFHSFKESEQSNFKLLRMMSEKDIKIMTIVLDKINVQSNLQNNKHLLYNKVVDILINIIISNKLLPENEKIIFIASRRETNKTLNEKFLSYLKSGHNNTNIEFKIETPQDKGLQLVDCACFSIYQKYEHKNTMFYDIIKPKIILEIIISE